MENKIAAQLTQDDITEINNAFQVIMNKMPFLITLTVKQKRSIQKLGNDKWPFTTEALKLAAVNPFINPGAEMLESAGADLALFNQLNQILTKADQLKNTIEDTKAVAGGNAYKTARIIYKKAKFGVDIKEPGAEVIYDELRKAFISQGKKSKKPDAT